MYIKKIVLAAIFTSLTLAAFASAPDCLLSFHLDYIEAEADLASNEEWCNNVAIPIFAHDCHKEADLIFDQAIDNALDDFVRCCCEQGLSCCI